MVQKNIKKGGDTLANNSKEQFIKISNDNIRNRKNISKLSDIGTYMILQAFVSIPDFKTPYGGLFSACLKHCSNGRYSFRNSWKRLKDNGFLKRIRMPLNKNHFTDFYTLLSSPDKTIEAVKNFSAIEGRRFMMNTHINFAQVEDDFTPVNREIIMDESISLQAKGLYAIIQYALALSANIDDIVITKDYIKTFCKEGMCSFNHYWRELKKSGYLFVINQYYDRYLKKTVYKYGLKNCAINKSCALYEKKSHSRKKKIKHYSDIYTRNELKDIIEQNVDVELLHDWSKNRTDAYYSSEDIDGTIDIMTDAVLNHNELKYNKKKVSALDLTNRLLNIDYAKLHSALNIFVNNRPKYNPINYLLSLLYCNSYVPAEGV